VVLTAAGSDSREAFAALEELCRTYWYPLYAFARRTGCPPEDAKDLTQGFFAILLEKQYLNDVNPGRGRFRSFLLASFKHFMANRRDRDRTQKRGGGRTLVPLQIEDGETRYSLEPVDDLTPERVYERRWALTLLGRALARLREEHVAAAKLELFEELKGSLAGGRGTVTLAEIGARIGMSEGAAKVAAHRLRRRYRRLLRQEIADTVATPDQIDDELRHLLNVVSG
jgi:RNA polymerase sigma-70 factor (ECF subfamily)